MKLETYVSYNMATRAIDVYFIDRDINSVLRIGEPPFVMEGCEPRPTLSIAVDNAQSLADQLWACGIRPTEGAGSAGALAAVQAHLEDMRKLVFENRVAG